MATPVSTLYRLVWGGRLYDQESWSCSLHVGSDAGLNLAASTFSAALIAWITRASSLVTNAARLDFVKFNQIDPVTGKYVLPTSNELIQNDLGTGVTGYSPPQLSVAVSTRTALSRGRGHAGRFYPPCGDPVIDTTTGRITGVIATGMATSASTLVASINTSVGAGSRVVVFSKVGQQAEPVTAIRVGRVVDTMRSRRRAADEDYSQVVV